MTQSIDISKNLPAQLLSAKKRLAILPSEKGGEIKLLRPEHEFYGVGADDRKSILGWINVGESVGWWVGTDTRVDIFSNGVDLFRLDSLIVNLKYYELQSLQDPYRSKNWRKLAGERQALNEAQAQGTIPWSILAAEATRIARKESIDNFSKLAFNHLPPCPEGHAAAQLYWDYQQSRNRAIQVATDGKAWIW